MQRLIILFLVAIHGTLAAQLPAPTMPPPQTLPMELLSAKPVQGGNTQYVRAGTKPGEYRTSRNPTLSDATWQPFTEGSVTTTPGPNGTRIAGLVPWSGSAATGANNCQQGTMRVRVFLQFRKRVLNAPTMHTQIKGDSACFPIPW